MGCASIRRNNRTTVLIHDCKLMNVAILWVCWHATILCRLHCPVDTRRQASSKPITTTLSASVPLTHLRYLYHVVDKGSWHKNDCKWKSYPRTVQYILWATLINTDKTVKWISTIDRNLAVLWIKYQTTSTTTVLLTTSQNRTRKPK